MILRFFFLPAFCLGLTACTADSLTDLSQEVNELITKGMPLDDARATLEKTGFQCSAHDRSNDDPATILCNRTQSHRLIASCVQNIYLPVSAERSRVAAIEIPNPSCTGL